MSDLTFTSVFCGTDDPLRPHHFEKPNSPDSKLPKSKSDLEVFLKKNPLMILEEGAKGVYQETPTWANAEINTTAGIEFEMTVILRGITGKGRANSKKAAKQKAALAYLHETVKKGKREDFFIPGETDAEAHANIDRISERAEDSKCALPVSVKEVDKSIPTVKEFPPDVPSSNNWVGALQEKSQKYKFAVPDYEDSKLDITNEFMVTCTVGNQKTRGIKYTKKAAKNLAAWLMLKSLEEGVGAVQSFDYTDQFEELEEDENLANIRKEAYSIKDKKIALVDLLSDKSRFSDYTMEFKFPSLSTHGVHQILLEIQISRPESPDPDDLQMGAEHTQTEEIMKATAAKEREQRKYMPDSGSKVFSGHGSSEEEAIQCACKSAIIHFNTYSFTD